MKKQLYARLYRLILNLWPCMRASGGRVTHLSGDFTLATVRLPLNWRTRNAVGTIFGGSMFSAADPMFMLMLREILGKDYVVWDKGATARFKRPARVTLLADFNITPEMLAGLRGLLDGRNEAVFTWTVAYKDRQGTVYAEFDRVMYVATKTFYEAKLANRAARQELPVESRG